VEEKDMAMPLLLEGEGRWRVSESGYSSMMENGGTGGWCLHVAIGVACGRVE
jgi:hypothetical protein